MAEISFEDLKKVFSLILENIEKESGQKAIVLEKDYYAEIPLSEKFENILFEPSEIVMGQLYDDWEFLQSVLSNPEEGVALMLDHLAPLLRYIAYSSIPKSVEE